MSDLGLYDTLEWDDEKILQLTALSTRWRQ